MQKPFLIRKNTPSLRNKLIEMGFEHRQNPITTADIKFCLIIHDGWFAECSHNTREDYIDCDNNEELLFSQIKINNNGDKN